MIENLLHQNQRLDAQTLEGDLRGHVFVQCSLNHCVVPKEGVDLYGATFYGCSMTFLEAEGSKWRHVSAQDCDFRHSNLKDAEFYQSRLHKCDFTWADFSHADARMLSGEGSDFKLSHIQKASRFNIWDRDMVSEIIRFHAHGDVEIIMAAALVKVSMEFCWKEFRTIANLPQYKKIAEVIYKVLSQYPQVTTELMGG